MALFINNTNGTAGLEIANHLVNTCGQNAAASSLANGLGAAIIHHDAALNLGTEGQPTLAELQSIFAAYKEGANFFALQNTGNGILFGAAGNNQLDAAVGSRFGSLDFCRHATGATGGTHATCAGFHLRRNLQNSVHQGCVGMSSGISSVQAIDVGQNDDQIRIHNACHQRGHIIIVANFQFVQSHHVVFVNDGDNTLLQKGHKGVAAIGITVAVDSLRAGNQHLGHDLTVVSKKLFIGVHQNALPYGGAGLLAGDGVGLCRQP